MLEREGEVEITLCVIAVAGNLCSLQSIGLGGNDIHDEGASHLAKALMTNTQLRSLGLGGNQIGECTCVCVCVCVCV